MDLCGITFPCSHLLGFGITLTIFPYHHANACWMLGHSVVQTFPLRSKILIWNGWMLRWMYVWFSIAMLDCEGYDVADVSEFCIPSFVFTLYIVFSSFPTLDTFTLALVGHNLFIFVGYIQIQTWPQVYTYIYIHILLYIIFYSVHMMNIQ